MNKAISLLLAFALAVSLAGCTERKEEDGKDGVQIALSDEGVTVDGAPVTGEETAAVYTANDIVFYLAGKGFTYGEGSEADEHTQAEADAHTVVHITQPGTYRLSGRLSAGQIAVDLGENAEEDMSAVVTLILDGADITCTVAPAIIFYCVYECGSKDTETASETVDTSRAGANVVLADGDALVLPMDYLLAVLDYIRQYFPECTRVAAYAGAKAIRGKTDEELRTLRQHGLGIVYIGLETGNEALLKKYMKGVTVEETIEQSLRAKAAGMTISITAISGMGGREQSEIHAIDTAKALSRIKADYVALLTLRVYTGTPLHDWIKNGEITMLGPIELAQETRLLLEHIDSEGSVFRSNHASNYLPLAGTLNRDREALIARIDAAIHGDVRFRRAVELGL